MCLFFLFLKVSFVARFGCILVFICAFFSSFCVSCLFLHYFAYSFVLSLFSPFFFLPFPFLILLLLFFSRFFFFFFLSSSSSSPFCVWLARHFSVVLLLLACYLYIIAFYFSLFNDCYKCLLSYRHYLEQPLYDHFD